jgi:hypothetical protein
MTKAELIAKLKACYRVGNASDSDHSTEREAWTTPAMASKFCSALDAAFAALVACDVIDQRELQEIYDTL